MGALLPKTVAQESAGDGAAWLAEELGSSVVMLVLIKIKTICFTSKAPYREKKKIAYPGPSLKVNSYRLMQIIDALCALTGFVSYSILRAYTCTEYSLIEMLRKSVNKT